MNIFETFFKRKKFPLRIKNGVKPLFYWWTIKTSGHLCSRLRRRRPRSLSPWCEYRPQQYRQRHSILRTSSQSNRVSSKVEYQNEEWLGSRAGSCWGKRNWALSIDTTAAYRSGPRRWRESQKRAVPNGEIPSVRIFLSTSNREERAGLQIFLRSNVQKEWRYSNNSKYTYNNSILLCSSSQVGSHSLQVEEYIGAVTDKSISAKQPGSNRADSVRSPLPLGPSFELCSSAAFISSDCAKEIGSSKTDQTELSTFLSGKQKYLGEGRFRPQRFVWIIAFHSALEAVEQSQRPKGLYFSLRQQAESLLVTERNISCHISFVIHSTQKCKAKVVQRTFKYFCGFQQRALLYISRGEDDWGDSNGQLFDNVREAQRINAVKSNLIFYVHLRFKTYEIKIVTGYGRPSDLIDVKTFRTEMFPWMRPRLKSPCSIRSRTALTSSSAHPDKSLCSCLRIILLIGMYYCREAHEPFWINRINSHL